MTVNKKEKFQFKIFWFVVVAFAAGTGVSVLLAWTGPSDDPPDNNVEAPVNVSATAQNKTGALGTGVFKAYGNYSGLNDYMQITASGDGGNTDEGLTLGYDTSNNVAHIYSRVVGTGSTPLSLNNGTLYITSASGRVGIGTTAPGASYKLDVSGKANATELCIAGTCKTAWPAAGITYAADETTLTLSGTTFSVKDSGITSAKINDGAVTTAKVAGDAVTLGTKTSGNYVLGLTAGTGLSVSGTAGEGWSPTIAISSGGVGTTEITDNSITFADWASNSCTNGQIPKYNGTAWVCGTDSGGTTYSADGTSLALTGTTFSVKDLGVGTAKIAVSAVTTAKILDGTILSADLADSSVTSAKITDGEIKFADWASNSCTDGQIPKYNGTSWACQSDATGAGSQWVSTGNDIYYTTGNVGVGTTDPTLTLTLGDSDTGIQWISDGVLAVKTNNVERFRISSGGYVGIGTANPTRPLHVAGATTTVAELTGGDTLVDTLTAKGTVKVNGTTGSTIGLLVEQGNVGIGISNPGAKLHVKGGGAVFESDTAQIELRRVDFAAGPTISSLSSTYPFSFKDAAGVTLVRINTAAQLLVENDVLAPDIDLSSPSWSAVNTVKGDTGTAVDGIVKDKWAKCPQGYFIKAIRFVESGSARVVPEVECAKL